MLDHTDAPPWKWKLWARDPPPSPATPPDPQPEVKPIDHPPLPDEGLQTLAQELETEYATLHTFWVTHGAKLQNEYPYPGIKNNLLQKMRQLDVDITYTMIELRKGQQPRYGKLDQVQKATHTIINEQSLRNTEFENILSDFSIYMTALTHIGSILYRHMHPDENATKDKELKAVPIDPFHPHPTPPRDADPVVVTPHHDGDTVLQVQDLKNMRFRSEIQEVITEWISLISPTGWTVVDVQRRILHQFRAYVQGIRALLQSPDSASLNIPCTLDGNYLCTITSCTPRFPDTPRWDYKRVVLVWPGGRQEAWDLQLDKSPRDGQTYILNFTCSEYHDIE